MDPLSYPSNIHIRPHLWQISGGSGPPPPSTLDPRMHFSVFIGKWKDNGRPLNQSCEALQLNITRSVIFQLYIFQFFGTRLPFKNNFILRTCFILTCIYFFLLCFSSFCIIYFCPCFFLYIWFIFIIFIFSTYLFFLSYLEHRLHPNKHSEW